MIIYESGKIKAVNILLTGSTGLFGKSFCNTARCAGVSVTGVARSMADISADMRDSNSISAVIHELKPQIVVNAAAIVNIDYCESNPDEAELVNAVAVASMVSAVASYGGYFVQISTDHYYDDEPKKLHGEEHHIITPNVYSKTKKRGEEFALEYERSTVVRTNIVGLSGKNGQATFLNWFFDKVRNKEEIQLFDDFFTSSLHVSQFSNILLRFIQLKPFGIYNIASSDALSKKDFLLLLGERAGLKFRYKTAFVNDVCKVKRARTLGLCTKKVESFLGIRMPSIDEVMRSILGEVNK